MIDGSIEIKCSAASQIVAVDRGSKSEAIWGHDPTSAKFPLKKFAGDWCRVMVVDAEGKTAWANPIYL